MRTQNIRHIIMLSSLLASSMWIATSAHAQSKQYQRKKTEAPAQAQPAASAKAGAKADAKAKEAAKPESDKLDITELEQKYWAPKDTDFSVVQNRTYTKEKRYSLSVLMGPVVNDPFNSGFNTDFALNYYFNERYGLELMYNTADLEDSKAVDRFRELPGGGTRPSYNRPINYTGLGFNYVPFYAKMSFIGKKIIYFDMQVTPHIGTSKYQQTVDSGTAAEKSAFSYGIDITQFFFFTKNFAVRANYHNRWYSEDLVDAANGTPFKNGEGTNVTNFLMGITYFF